MHSLRDIYPNLSSTTVPAPGTLESFLNQTVTALMPDPPSTTLSSNMPEITENTLPPDPPRVSPSTDLSHPPSNTFPQNTLETSISPNPSTPFMQQHDNFRPWGGYHGQWTGDDDGSMSSYSCRYSTYFYLHVQGLRDMVSHMNGQLVSMNIHLQNMTREMASLKEHVYFRKPALKKRKVVVCVCGGDI